VNLRSRHPLGHSASLDDLGSEGSVLLTVDEFLTLGDLEFPVLLDEREDVDSFIGERDAVDGRTYVRRLCRSYLSLSEVTWRFRIEGRTWTTTFPGASIVSWIVDWEWWISVSMCSGAVVQCQIRTSNLVNMGNITASL